jgi:hypothetical protein
MNLPLNLAQTLSISILKDSCTAEATSGPILTRWWVIHIHKTLFVAQSLDVEGCLFKSGPSHTCVAVLFFSALARCGRIAIGAHKQISIANIPSEVNEVGIFNFLIPY